MGLCKCKWAINPLSKGKVEILWKEGSLGGSLHYVLLWTNDRQKHIKWPWNCSESALLKIGASILNIWGSQQKFMGKDQTQAEKQCLKYMQPTIVGVLFTFLLWASANAFYICYEKFASIWVSGTIRIFAMQQSTLRIQWGRVKYVA